MKKITFSLFLIFSLVAINCSGVKEISNEELFLIKKNSFFENFETFKTENNIPRSTRIQKINVNHTSNIINIEFTKDLVLIPLREDNVDELYSEIKAFFGERFSGYSFILLSNNYAIEEFIPNFYRTDKSKVDSKRLPVTQEKDRIAIVRNVSRNYNPIKGLKNKNVLLWHSHGWYYNNKEKRWMWQRARLFQTVEDTGPLAFTIPFLIPMLENAGANVFIPRERDIQKNEIIIDNDFSTHDSYSENSTLNSQWMSSEMPGFGMQKDILKGNENPFQMGTSRFTISTPEELSTVQWLPDIPETGEYAVYISYSSSPENISDALYEVHHSGGITKFQVNQKIGGGTWIYLGTFKFKKGRLDGQGVVLSNRSLEPGKIVSADAVRFGGGMGIVEREGQVSRRPKFVEGSRYWLQFAGMPDTIIYNLNEGNDDYKDDYQSRAEYGNFLFGNPYGPTRNRSVEGLGIPIDASLAFHTDAGITRNDTVIGTLMIYSIPGMDSLHIFPDSGSRLANRDLSDIVQTQIVEDIRSLYDSSWNRRQLMDALYSEAARPNFPSMLLELLSHQNFLDMKFHLDPRFRFDASRAIYKGILKFLSFQYGFNYVVQPLPVTHFTVELKNGKVNLSWQAQIDTLEPTATAEKFVVYMKLDDNGFNNGTVVENNSYIFDAIEEGRIYSFKVTAINQGGESFPSEVLSVGISGNEKEPLLIVNGFDRVSPPQSIESDNFTGFLNFLDEGVPYKYDYGFTGIQFNYDPDSKWMTDDNPGHGASASDYETQIIAGNTFDFSYVHGKAILENGFSFCSVSDESVWDSKIDLDSYKFVNFIFGEEKKTFPPKMNNRKNIEFVVFPELLKEKIKSYLGKGGKIFLSGSYIGSDLYSDADSSGIRFANDVLKIKLMTSHAVRTGELTSSNDDFISKQINFKFNTSFNDSIYKVEAPDEIGNVNGSEVLMRYSENNFSAAVGYIGNYGVVTFGFPFETVLNEKDRNKLMESVLKYLDIK